MSLFNGKDFTALEGRWSRRRCSTVRRMALYIAAKGMPSMIYYDGPFRDQLRSLTSS